jgi:prepilin-type N-terminal cleavage/methylation domain-containing protein
MDTQNRGGVCPGWKKGSIQGHDGFTVVEVMVGVFLLAIFMAGALGLLSQTMRTHSLVRDRTGATNLAWSRIERASNLEFSALQDLAEADIRINRSGLPDDQGEYLRSTTVTPLSGALNAVQIRVEVRHLDRRSGEFSSSPEVIETILTNILRIAEEGS